MSNPANRYARWSGSNLQHELVAGTKATLCGKDATLANRYPAITVANSADRRVWRRCAACTAKRPPR